MSQKSHSFRSPIKAAPLHEPGQSLSEQIDDLIHDNLIVPFMVAVAITVLAGVELYRWYRDIPPDPRTVLLFAAVVWFIAVVMFLRTRSRLRELKLERDGEKAVGQYLELLRESGARVFHDVPGDHFNLDHVVIAPQGIFVVETKTLNKPEKGKAEIVVKQGTIFANGRQVEQNPIDHAIALAEWLGGFLEKSTGKRFPVRPAVVFPGWYIYQHFSDASKGVWVLNPKGLPKFLARLPQILSADEIKLASAQLSRYVRSRHPT